MASKKFVSPGDLEQKVLRKENRILAYIRKNPGVSRQDCANEIRISTFSASQLIASLIKQKQLLENKPVSTGGRPFIPLELNPRYQYFAGIDFEAMWWRFAIIDFAGHLVFSQIFSFSYRNSREEYMAEITELLQQSINAAGKLWEKVTALGVGMPGFIDAERGEVLQYEILPGFEHIPVRELCADISKKPVYVTHNIFSIATYSLWTHAFTGDETILNVAIRSGISMAFNIHDEVYQGSNKHAGEIGLCLFEGRPLQEIAGLWALKRLLPELDEHFWQGDADVIAREYSEKRVRDTIDRGLYALANMLVNSAAVLDCAEIKIYSVMFPTQNVIWARFVAFFYELRALQRIADPVRLTCAEDSMMSSACGAALFALERIYRCGDYTR